MNLFDTLRALAGQGVALLESVHGRSKESVAEALKISRSEAGEWLAVADTLYGPCRAKKRQAEARGVAAGAGHSVDALVLVEKHLRKLNDRQIVWSMRAELYALTGTVDEIGRAAAARVRAQNLLTDPSEAQARAGRSVKGGKNPDPRGRCTFTVTGPERDVKRFLGGVQKAARALRARDGRLTYEQAMFDALMAGRGAVEKLTPVVIVGLPDWAKLVRHEGDECVFAVTDGSTITGAELVRHLVGQEHLVALYDPVEGPVNLYRTRRTVSPKQKILADVEAPVCVGDGCTTPATQSQGHHIDSWARGGPTNQANITNLCPRDNGRNDDDPNAPPKHGRAVRVGGRPQWLGPDGRLRPSRHPLMALAAGALVDQSRSTRNGSSEGS